MIATALLLLGVFVFPLWVIHLQAPQYPQGLGIHIWINKIDGAAPHDLQNINGLNHYIGMMSIEPGEIPELRFMQYFAIGLAFLAALVAALRRRWALLAWVIIAVSLSGIGLYDFYQWEYNYGHNLNPEAAIKIEGMSYQPPMFGTKQLLNFHTTAWPGVGGILAMLGVGLSVLALGYEFVVRPRRGQSGPDQAPRPVSSRAAALVSLAMLAVLASGCSKEPLAIAFGTDACEYCAMTISNERYGAAFVTSRGRTHKFDSVECMLQAQMPGEKFADSKIHMMYAVPYEFKGTLLPIDKVIFLVSEDMPSPMGANITAFSSKEDAEHVQEIKGGEIMGFDALKVHATQKVHS
ncbi:MAG TPA: nitrous oxide reductase accessory protein NosL [Candidatus Krumholzibacteria bacterium]|nr:nitrous oxide reductase accessory protein NosL [Candidatus Krumholzibacteria bacterium]